MTDRELMDRICMLKSVPHWAEAQIDELADRVINYGQELMPSERRFLEKILEED